MAQFSIFVSNMYIFVYACILHDHVSKIIRDPQFWNFCVETFSDCNDLCAAPYIYCPHSYRWSTVLLYYWYPPIFLSLVLILEKRLFLEHIINFEFSHFWRVHDSSFLFRGDHHRHVTPWSPIIYPLTGVLLIIPTVLFSQDTLCELTCYVF